MKGYSIKAGYRENLGTSSFEGEEFGSYWTELRIQTASLYQWYVYEEACRIAVRNGFRRILDVGSGPPRKLAEIFGRGDYAFTLVDQPNVAGLAARFLPQATFVPANLESPLLENPAEADLVICADVVEHLRDPLPCLELIKASMATNSIAVISTPDRDLLYGKDMMRSGHPSHVREWNSAEFRSFLEEVGFAVVSQTILPQKKLVNFGNKLKFALSRLGIPSSLMSCQMAVCKLPDRLPLRTDSPVG